MHLTNDGFLKQLLLVQALLTLLVFVGSEEHGPEESSVHGPLIQDDRVLLVVSSVGCDSNDGVYAWRSRICLKVSSEAMHI